MASKFGHCIQVTPGQVLEWLFGAGLGGGPTVGPAVGPLASPKVRSGAGPGVHPGGGQLVLVGVGN